MLKRCHFVLKPDQLWKNIHELTKGESDELLPKLQNVIIQIRNHTNNDTFATILSEMELDSINKLGKTKQHRTYNISKLICKLEDMLQQ